MTYLRLLISIQEGDDFMSQENVEQTLATLQACASILKQLQQILVAEGKSSSAVRLMQDISNRDIGMLCCRIPMNWRSDTRYSQQFEFLLTEIGLAATSIGDKMRGKESGLPALSMLSDQIVMSISRVEKASASDQSTAQKESKGHNTKWWQLWK
jgi:hypothetical protein